MHHSILLQFTLLFSLLICVLLVSAFSLPITTAAATTTDTDYDLVYKCFYDHSTWMWDKSNHCHVVAYGGGKSSFTDRELKQRHMFQEMIQEDRKDRQLVRHCFLYHQFDLNYEPCQGISWERPKSAKYRQARLMRLWAENVKEQRKKIAFARYFEGSDESLIATCLYTTEWLRAPTHACHQVVYAGGLKSPFDAHDLSLQSAYRERRFQDQVADCYFYHRTDQYVKCYDITWSVSREFKRNELVDKIWRQLEATKAKPE